MKSWSHFKLLAGVLAAALLFLCVPLRAAADDDDPPGRVARLRSIQGSVSFDPTGTDEWGAAEVNRPITTGDKLWSDQDSRAELHLGSAAIRLGSQTAFTFLNLTDQMAQISVNEGTLNVHLRSLADQETFEIDTPNLAFSLLRPGDYRIGVNENGDTTIITTRGGQGEVTGGGQAFTIYPNQTATFVGTDQLTPDIGTALPPDDFDAWCGNLNTGEDRPARYVSQDVIGYEDLQGYGSWQSVPDYGEVWVPGGVVAGWAPYRYGHWAWISPWGWTWVDDAPWGFAPFHYGRWVFVGGFWAWTPGPAVVGVRQVYAPALVAWVGGPRFGLSVAVGGVAGVGVAWFPLGPREVYVPPYTVSRTYVTNVNITNTVVERTYVTSVYNNYQANNVTNVTYVNRSYVTATSQNAFTSAQPIGRNIAQVNQEALARAPVGTASGAGVAPQPRSVFGGAAPSGNVARPPATVAARPVVAKTAPPPPPPSFASQQKALQANAGKPLAPSQLSAIRPTPSAAAKAQTQVRIAPPATPAASTGRPASGGNAPPSASTKPVAPEQPARPSNQPAPNAPAYRSDRPPSAQPTGAVPPANSNNQPSQPARKAITNDDIKPTNPPSSQPAAKPAPQPSTTEKPQPAQNPNRPPTSTQPAKPAEQQANPQAHPKNSSEKPPKKTDNKKPSKEKPESEKEKP